MAKVNHVNFMDEQNRVYCRLRNKVVELDEAHERDFCSTCPFYRGSAQGEGVECEWEDIRDVQDPYLVYRPDTENDNIKTAEAKAKRK